MKRFPVEVWTKNSECDRTGLVKDAPTFILADDKEQARDRVVAKLVEAKKFNDSVEIVICHPFAR